MFIDELIIEAQAGRGGDGVVRWRHEKFVPEGGPSGGDGGRGGDVYIRSVRDLSILSKYTGSKKFKAEDGEAGARQSRHGRDGADIYIDVPRGATITDLERGTVYTLADEGETQRILTGGRGGLGNEYFKSATNRAPEESTKGYRGEAGTFKIELSLVVDLGLVGLPNAGKSTLLNALTNTHVKVGAYPFTTIEPSLGECFGFIIADIPGLIEGASDGKGLGHKFLKHIERTKMLFHCVSLDNEDPVSAYKVIRAELEKFDPELLKKEEWIILTKNDLCEKIETQKMLKKFSSLTKHPVMSISGEAGEGVKALRDSLVQHLSNQKTK